MKYQKTELSQEDLFRNRLSNQLNPRHEMMKLSELIPWSELEKEFGDMWPDDGGAGRPAKPVRLMIGLLLLQYMYDLSDENVIRGWIENPYWQYFCGYDFIQWEFPVDPSSLTRWRQRIGSERLEKILNMTVQVSVQSGAVKPKNLASVVSDTTVMSKNIEFPTDTKLLAKSRAKIVRFAKENGIQLRQHYKFVTKKLLFQISRYFLAKQFKRANKAQRFLKTIVGRVMRDCERKTFNNEYLKEKFSEILKQTQRLLNQQRSDKEKLYSLHEEAVDCISKGKAHKKYEFGCKVALTMTHRGLGIFTSALALHGNPYDGHTLPYSLDSSERITGVKVQEAFVDKGYKGHGVEGIKIFISGQRKGITKSIKRKMKRRQAIEPLIGHIKNECKLGLCKLKGIKGDQIHAILCAAGYNLKQILNYLRKLLVQFLNSIFCLQNKNYFYCQESF